MTAAASFTPTIAASASSLKNPVRSRLLRLSAPASYSQSFVRCKGISSFKMVHLITRAQASSVGDGSYSEVGKNIAKNSGDSSGREITSQGKKTLAGVDDQLSIAGVLLVSALAFSLVFLNGGPSAIMAALEKSGFTTAFRCIFVSEIRDKTFFTVALLAMQYNKAMVLLGSMGALSLVTILSVKIGRIFSSVSLQSQVLMVILMLAYLALPIWRYGTVALLTFFSLASVKKAWDLPPNVSSDSRESSELEELVDAEEILKEKVATKSTNPFLVLWISFSIVQFAGWGHRLILTTLALGGVQRSYTITMFFGFNVSQWGIAVGIIAGHLVATTIAIVGGALLANYISEKMVGYCGGVLYLIFAVAALFEVF